MRPLRWLFMAMALLLPPLAAAQSGLPIPVELAEPAVQHALKAFPHNAEYRKQFIRGYADAYLYSLRVGKSFKHLTVNSTEAGNLGYATAAKEILRAGKSDSIHPEAFGYRFIQMTGVYRSDLELSELETDDGRKYHVSRGDVEEIPQEVKVKLSGWLSPEWGLGFGHVSQWKQEIIVLTVEVL